MNDLKIKQDIHNLYHYETHKEVESEEDIINDLISRVEINITYPSVYEDDLTIELEDNKIKVDTSYLTYKDQIDYTDHSNFSDSLEEVFAYIEWLENKLINK